MGFRLSSVSARGDRLKRSWRPDGVAVASVILLVVGFGVFRLHFWHLRHPVLFAGDVDVVLEYVKNALQNGGTTIDPQIGYPDRASLAAFPVFDALSAGVLKLLSLFTADPVTGANLLAYADHVLSGVVAYCCLRVLRIPIASAIFGAVAFAWAEFGMYYARVFPHETLQLYAPLTIGATIALLPVARPDAIDRWEVWFGALAGAVIVGCAQPYWVAFSLIVVGSAVVGCIAAGRFRGAGLLSLSAATMGGVAAFCLLWPRLWGEPALVIHRSAFEQPVHGLRIINLLLPPRSTVPLLNHLYTHYLDHSSGYSEGFDAFVGWAGLFGLLIGVGLILRAPFLRASWARIPAAEAAAALAAILILFATSYGLGELFNIVVTPEIRAQNRVSPLVAFLAIFIFADVMRRLARGRALARRAASLAVPLVVALGLFDASSGVDYAMLQAAPEIVQRWDDAKADAATLGSALTPGSRILLLPYMPFPESPPVQSLGSYTEMDLALFTRGFHYSFGSPPMTPALAGGGSPVEQAIDAAAVGYDELLLYRAGYEDGGAGPRRALEAALGAKPNVDAPGVFGFDLRPLQAGLPPLDPAALAVRVDWAARGFSGLERNPDLDMSFRWDDSDDARAGVSVRNGSSAAVEMRLCGTVVAATPGAYTVTVEVPGQVIRPPTAGVGTAVDVIFAAPPGTSAVTIAMPAPQLVTAPAETRRIHFQIRSPWLTPVAVLTRARAVAGRLGIAMPVNCP